MSKKIYTSFDELALMLTVIQVHDIRGIAQQVLTNWFGARASPPSRWAAAS